MPYLIDGHNLIGQMPGKKLGELDDELELIRMLEAYCRKSRRRAEVYFDGAPPGSSGMRKSGLVTAHFVRKGTTADEAIAAFLDRLGGAASNWTVVSSDLRVRRAALAVHARAVSSSQFLRSMAESGPPGVAPEKPEAVDVDEWLDIFK